MNWCMLSSKYKDSCILHTWGIYLCLSLTTDSRVLIGETQLLPCQRRVIYWFPCVSQLADNPFKGCILPTAEKLANISIIFLTHKNSIRQNMKLFRALEFAMLSNLLYCHLSEFCFVFALWWHFIHVQWIFNTKQCSTDQDASSFTIKA